MKPQTRFTKLRWETNDVQERMGSASPEANQSTFQSILLVRVEGQGQGTHLLDGNTTARQKKQLAS